MPPVLAAWAPCFALFAAFLVWGIIRPRQARLLVTVPERGRVKLLPIGTALGPMERPGPSPWDELPGLLLALTLTPLTL